MYVVALPRLHNRPYLPGAFVVTTGQHFKDLVDTVIHDLIEWLFSDDMYKTSALDARLLYYEDN